VSPEERIEVALDLIDCYGRFERADHKQWLLDQVVRALAGDGYDDWVRRHCASEDDTDPDAYDWDEGVPP
jgi:hypothetical protein